MIKILLFYSVKLRVVVNYCDYRNFFLGGEFFKDCCLLRGQIILLCLSKGLDARELPLFGRNRYPGAPCTSLFKDLEFIDK